MKYKKRRKQRKQTLIDDANNDVLKALSEPYSVFRLGPHFGGKGGGNDKGGCWFGCVWGLGWGRS